MLEQFMFSALIPSGISGQPKENTNLLKILTCKTVKNFESTPVSLNLSSLHLLIKNYPLRGEDRKQIEKKNHTHKYETFNL